ncbi:MAG: quinolinate synthase NadA [Peptococcaceae bacterium]|nr:quinolinate synthase NadA [Peptococcaceae bacterium]
MHEVKAAHPQALVLAHYYVRPEVQAIADYIGDSFYLSKVAANLDAKTIVFAGVFFMGESAKVLNPGKTVLLPDMKADCAMAHMADVATIQKMRETYDDLAVVCYINSTAELKQHSDVCVTSSNAVKIVKALPNKNIFFIPDRNLARYVAAQVPEKNFVFNEGYCPIHEQILMNELHEVKAAHPQALVLAHPECKKELLDEADYIGSTSGIIDYATNSDAKEFIICTENGIRNELEQKNPDKQFYFTKTEPVCPDMKTVTLEKVRDVLKYGTNNVQVTDKLREESQKPLARMLELGK